MSVLAAMLVWFVLAAPAVGVALVALAVGQEIGRKRP